MTSFAFILGVVPLVLASGAGAEMRRALGLAVFSGMLGVTFFGIFLTPVFFYVLRAIRRKRKSPNDEFGMSRGANWHGEMGLYSAMLQSEPLPQ